MKRLLIALGGLAGCARNGIGERAATDRTPWELLGLLFLSLVVFVVLVGLLALRSGRALPTHSGRPSNRAIGPDA